MTSVIKHNDQKLEVAVHFHVRWTLNLSPGYIHVCSSVVNHVTITAVGCFSLQLYDC